MRLLKLLIVFGLGMVVLALAPVSAHEGREVGEYEIFFGWREEPAYAGLFNGPEVFIALHGGEEDAAFPADVVVTLQAEATFGPSSTTVFFEPAFGETGHYIADLIPTLPGDYSFRVTGTIGDVAVDETFSSTDGGFSPVEPATDIMFPPLEGDANARIAELEARIAALEALISATPAP